MAKTLLILGNGFDIQHGLKTNYNDFKKFLWSDNYSLRYDLFPSVVASKTIYAKKALKILLVCSFCSDNYEPNFCLGYDVCLNDPNQLDDKMWNCFEEELSSLTFERLATFRVDGKMIFDGVESIELYRENFENLFLEIPHVFQQWLVKTVDYSLCCRDKFFEELLSSVDFCLSFNFTRTLENVYGFPLNRICHIHGTVDTGIIIGHGFSPDVLEFDSMPYGIEISQSDIELNKTFRNLFKNVHKIIADNRSRVFEKLNDIDKIYSYGFSFSSVDVSYIEEICHHSNVSCLWYDNVHKNCVQEREKEKDRRRKLLEQYGFKGKYLEF